MHIIIPITEKSPSLETSLTAYELLFPLGNKKLSFTRLPLKKQTYNI